MVKIIKKEGGELYQCSGCGFHYEDEATAKRCEEWCTKNQSCNLEIIQHSLESKEAFKRNQ